MNELLMFWNSRSYNKDDALQLQAVPQLERELHDLIVQHPYCGLTSSPPGPNYMGTLVIIGQHSNDFQ